MSLKMKKNLWSSKIICYFFWITCSMMSSKSNMTIRSIDQSSCNIDFFWSNCLQHFVIYQKLHIKTNFDEISLITISRFSLAFSHSLHFHHLLSLSLRVVQLHNVHKTDDIRLQLSKMSSYIHLSKLSDFVFDTDFKSTSLIKNFVTMMIMR